MIRYEIVRGGEPSPEELAALVLALTPVASPSRPTGTTDRSGWLRAALREAVGQRNYVSADDIDAALPGAL